MKKTLAHFFKDKWNIAIVILVLLVIILGSILIGFVKIMTVITLVIILGLVVKYGGSLIMAKKKSKGKKNVKSNNKKGWKKVVSSLIIVFLCLAIVGIIGGIGFIGYVVSNAPEFDKQKLYYKEASILYDSEGKEITRMGIEMRDKVTFDEIPQVFIDAIIATEDSRYFEHNGFDLPRFLVAFKGQALGNSGAGGASTISMQVVKNNFTSATQTITRKLADIYLAIFKLEKMYTKEQILEFYVNNIHLGVNNTLGIAEASRGLFGKEISDINLSEAALLAGMFQAPGAYSPRLYPEKAAARRSTVLYLMERHGYITSEERKIANNIPIESMLVDSVITGHPYQFYIDYVAREVFKKTEYDPMVVPMKIYTNLNTKKQDHINKILNGETFTFENDLVQAAIAVTDVKTGAVIALGGGRNRTGKKLFNLATDSKRQIGSTAKPIFDYGPAMEYNNFSTYTPLVDDVYGYSSGQNVNNWDYKYQGMITMRNALARSRNIPALKTFQQLDNKMILEFAKSLGITPEIENGIIHEAHALGAFNGVSPLELATAYAAFGNGGYYIKPHAVNKIEFMDTNEVVKYKPEKVRVMSEATAYMITDVLKYAVDSGNVSGRINGIAIAGKSGTTSFDDETKKRNKLPYNAVNDLWNVGYSPDYTVSLWYGYEKINSTYYSKMNPTGGIKNKLFLAVAKGIFEKSGKTFPIPNSVVRVKVESETIPAMLPSPYTPSNMITTEYFRKGTEPTEVSPRFNTLPNVSGLDVSKDNTNVKLTWDPVSAPNMITEEYLKTIAAQKTKYLDIREKKDSTLLGALGYNVYLKKETGELSLLGWTANTDYTHTPTTTGSLTYVVKTCYSIFKNSESTGATITLSNSPYIALPMANLSTNVIDGITYTDSGKTTTVIKGTNYIDAGFKVLIDAEDVTNSDKTTAVITVTNMITGTKTTATKISDVIIDTSTEGITYKINYEITYDGKIVDPLLERMVSIVNP
ncbi:MAG: transglycosylase domain-containing protein [Bacilli bacterium]|nr:transglycosylase domain-containing protein [Bacilli bacterium]MDD4298216.1 transglycosylase domain-containing protein [Bacilli bacterium]